MKQHSQRGNSYSKFELAFCKEWLKLDEVFHDTLEIQTSDPWTNAGVGYL